MTAYLPPIAVFDRFLSENDHRELLNFALTHENAFRPATVYKQDVQQVERAKRNAYRLQADIKPAISTFVAEIESRIQTLFECVSMQCRPVARLETEIVAYNDGGCFHEHIDTLTGALQAEQGENQARALSAVYYFSREPKGFKNGQLRIWGFFDGAERPFLDVEPANNTLVVFPSFVAHEVLPVSCPSRAFGDSRFAVNCWVHCRL